MDSKQNTLNSATNSIDKTFPANGYPLKKYLLKNWIYANGYTQPYVARRMGLSPYEFKRRLKEREKFNRGEISALVRLMDAEDAFEVIYFPTMKIRRRVWREVFGKYENKEELNE